MTGENNQSKSYQNKNKFFRKTLPKTFSQVGLKRRGLSAKKVAAVHKMTKDSDPSQQSNSQPQSQSNDPLPQITNG
jgi:hypothetical protein